MWMLTTWLIFVFCIQSSAAYIKLRATSIRVNVGRSLFICLVYRVGRFIHTMVHSFTHLFIPSFIHWDIYSQCSRKTHIQQTVVWVTLSQNRIPVFEVVTLINTDSESVKIAPNWSKLKLRGQYMNGVIIYENALHPIYIRWTLWNPSGRWMWKIWLFLSLLFEIIAFSAVTYKG